MAGFWVGLFLGVFVGDLGGWALCWGPWCLFSHELPPMALEMTSFGSHQSMKSVPDEKNIHRHFPNEVIRFGAMAGHVRYEFIGFGAMDKRFAYEFIGFGAMEGFLHMDSYGSGHRWAYSYEFIGFGAMVVYSPHILHLFCIFPSCSDQYQDPP